LTGLTIYQEVYDEEKYKALHLKGPKRNYLYRLDAPERACKASMRNVNIGALLGLHDWRTEAFYTGLHADYLQNKYPDVEIGLSLPRIRPHPCMIAYRLFMPRAGIESLRNNLIGLGVTKMSAASSTEVGGHTLGDKSDGQFDVNDRRGVFKDWQAI